MKRFSVFQHVLMLLMIKKCLFFNILCKLNANAFASCTRTKLSMLLLTANAQVGLFILVIHDLKTAPRQFVRWQSFHLAQSDVNSERQCCSPAHSRMHRRDCLRFLKVVDPLIVNFVSFRAVALRKRRARSYRLTSSAELTVCRQIYILFSAAVTSHRPAMLFPIFCSESNSALASNSHF